METFKKILRRLLYPFYFYEKWGMGIGTDNWDGGPGVMSGFVIFAALVFSVFALIGGVTLVQYGLTALVIYLFGQFYFGKSDFFDFLTASALFCMGLVLVIFLIVML